MTTLKISLLILVTTLSLMATPPKPVGKVPNITTYSTYTCVDMSGKISRLDFTRQSNFVIFPNTISWNYGEDMVLNMREVHYFKAIYAQRPTGESNGKPYYTIGNGINWIQNCELNQPRTGEKIDEPQYIPKQQVHKTYQCISKNRREKVELHFIRETNTGVIPYFYYGKKLNYSNKIPAQGRYLVEYESILKDKPKKGGIYNIVSSHLKTVKQTCTLLSTKKE